MSVVPADRRVKYVYLTADLWMDFLHFRHRAREMSPRFEAREETPRLVSAAVPLLRAGGGRRPGEGPLAPASARGLSLRLAQSVSVSRVQQIPASLGPASSGQPGPGRHIKHSLGSCPRHESLHEPAYYCDTHQR